MKENSYEMIDKYDTLSEKERTIVSNKTMITCETTLSMTPPESPEAPRAGARESSSSKKMTQGRAALACRRNQDDFYLILTPYDFLGCSKKDTF